MKINELHIQNFRGVREVHLEKLGTMVIVAGQNGSGKSCIFDAIRLLKSAYGGYQTDEWQQWLGEFQIRLRSNHVEPKDFHSMLNDVTRPASISAKIFLSETEKSYMSTHATSLLRSVFWNNEVGRNVRARSPFMNPAVSEEKIDLAVEELRRELELESIDAKINFYPDKLPEFEPSSALNCLFSTYQPESLGIIDFHGASRNYGREYVQSVNFDIAENTNKGQSALYNYTSKYANVKSEMAASYLHDVLAGQAGVSIPGKPSITKTLQDLFTTFFPDKRFEGPTPTAQGKLEFNVQLSNGFRHDIDELSAGEKEVIYGYLRARNSAPRNSVILIDEPELHLNPKLARDLPAFYRHHLGEAVGNQIWLVTHSDAILREVVGVSGYDVFHMLPASFVKDGEKQLRSISLSEDLSAALIDLVGDLAAYHPGSRVVIFEGGGDSDFDKNVVAKLFPDIVKTSSLISGNSKMKVRALHELLERAHVEGGTPYKFFSVTDRDSDDEIAIAPNVRALQWSKYHLENYLLEPEFIEQVLNDLSPINKMTASDVEDALRECARKIKSEILSKRLTRSANSILVRCVNTRLDPKSKDVVADLSEAIKQSLSRLSQAGSEELSVEVLSAEKSSIESELDAALLDGQWRNIFPGRSILKRFVGDFGGGVKYRHFVNLIVSRMQSGGYQPPGMKLVIDRILAGN